MNNKKKKYPICSISRHRMETDGKGIRTLIFLSGCPLRCKYCLNPRTWSDETVPVMMSAQEVYSKIRIDRPYMLATGGGLTFGGGEPMLHSSLINAMRELCEPELSFVVETSLNVDWSRVEETADVIDLFVVDVKTTDPDTYRAYTGGELSPVLNNLQKLLNIKSPDNIVIRIPSIEGYVTEEMQKESKLYLQGMGFKRFNLFRYDVKTH